MINIYDFRIRMERCNVLIPLDGGCVFKQNNIFLFQRLLISTVGFLLAEKCAPVSSTTTSTCKGTWSRKREPSPHLDVGPPSQLITLNHTKGLLYMVELLSLIPTGTYLPYCSVKFRRSNYHSGTYFP